MDSKNDKPVAKAAAVKNTRESRSAAPTLLYIGQGASIPDVPARDLSDDDLLICAEIASADPLVLRAALVSSELYKEA
jgi:hypothetical protein